MKSNIVGTRIKRLRQTQGLSRQELARFLRVDVTAVAAWEAGKYMPREKHRAALSRALSTEIGILFNGSADDELVRYSATLVQTLEDLPTLLLNLLDRTRNTLRTFRLAAPYSTAAHIQQEFRSRVAARILDKSLEVMRIEIFYDLVRLKEILSNIFRYAGCRYYVKAHCVGAKDVAPAMGGYIFDESEILLGAYWSAVPPHNKPGLHVSGPPFRSYFNAYWDEIWGRGTYLNIGGCHDLGAVREVAMRMGLPKGAWSAFVEDARRLEIGDGAPPLV